MEVYEIINPSDKVLIASDDFEAVAVAVSILGQGNYGLKTLPDEEQAMPIFLFGGHDEWFDERFGHDFETSMNLYCGEKRSELIDTFESCMIGDYADFDSYYNAMELIPDVRKRDEFREQWREARRTSLNDICGRAHNYAQQLRTAENPTP